MSRSDISIKLSKQDETDALILLKDFALACNALKLSVASVSQCIAGLNDEYTIEQLEVGSAFVAIRPHHESRLSVQQNEEVSKVFVDSLSAIQDGRELDDRLTFEVIQSLDRFSPLIRRGHTIEANSNVYLDSRFTTHINSILEKEAPSYGSVTGRLEQLNLHNKRSFTLFPPIHNEKVECVFTEDLELDEVLKSVNRNITVYGTLFYSQRKVFPVKVEVKSFEVHPDSDSLPTLLDVKTPWADNRPNDPDDDFRSGWEVNA